VTATGRPRELKPRGLRVRIAPSVLDGIWGNWQTRPPPAQGPQPRRHRATRPACRAPEQRHTRPWTHIRPQPAANVPDKIDRPFHMSVTVTACGHDGCDNDRAIGRWLPQPSPRSTPGGGLRAGAQWSWWLAVRCGGVRQWRFPAGPAVAGRAPLTGSLPSRIGPEPGSTPGGVLDGLIV
jgi:hypothetical protein